MGNIPMALFHIKYGIRNLFHRHKSYTLLFFAFFLLFFLLYFFAFSFFFVRVMCFTEVFVVLTSVCKVFSDILRWRMQKK